MTLESQVCSLELAKKLKELGVKQESDFYYTKFGLQFRPFPDNREFSAFTVAELGEMLPQEIDDFEGDNQVWYALYSAKSPDYWSIYYKNQDRRFRKVINADTEANTRAKMLIYLLENKLIKL